jgi:hypothetical protein
MKKVDLIKLLENVPEDGEILLDELSSDGFPNFKRIKDIQYDEYLKAWKII